MKWKRLVAGALISQAGITLLLVVYLPERQSIGTVVQGFQVRLWPRSTTSLLGTVLSVRIIHCTQWSIEILKQAVNCTPCIH